MVNTLIAIGGPLIWLGLYFLMQMRIHKAEEKYRHMSDRIYAAMDRYMRDFTRRHEELRKETNMLRVALEAKKKCPQCATKKVVRDFEVGDYICRQCREMDP